MQLASDTRSASKPTIDWSKRLPRTFAEVLSMPMTHQDRAGFIESTAAEIKSIRDMRTYDPHETLDETQMKNSKIGMSKIVFTKKYHPDGSFDKYKVDMCLEVTVGMTCMPTRHTLALPCLRLYD